jgi:hypothetical protein
MGLRITVAVVLLGVMLVGCDAAATPSVLISASASTTAQQIAPSTAPPASASPTSAARATATPVPKPRPTPAAPPPPTAVRITRHGCYTGPDPDGIPPGKCTTTLSWKKVLTKGTEIHVYGVTGCLSLKESAGDGSCLVLHTAVPPSVRKLIARAPASKGTLSWTGPAWLDVIQVDISGPRYQAIGVDRHGDDIYFAIVVTASNDVGHSKFIIADAGTWCYDTGCVGP